MESTPRNSYQKKEKFLWTSMIRQSEFVTLEVFSEGLCVQCMHMGPFDDEPATLEMMDAFIRENGFVHDFAGRRHHEIYLSDPRKTVAGKMKTILRVPVKTA
ncbi:MAG: GyrI-like domain-containing protein [Bacilli bacterium]|nr:GyrI-like domain-containing protein [Bacilli bacterium]